MSSRPVTLPYIPCSSDFCIVPVIRHEILSGKVRFLAAVSNFVYNVTFEQASGLRDLDLNLTVSAL